MAASLLAGCAILRIRRADTLSPVPGWWLPSFSDDHDTDSLRVALERTLGTARLAPKTRRSVERLLELAGSPLELSDRRSAIARSFRVMRVGKPVLLTAYYEPEITAQRQPGGTYRHPIYARPPDLVDADPGALDAECRCRRLVGRLQGDQLVPYPTRADIDRGVLSGRGLELAWADDPVDLFLLHVQGSGLVRLPDGQRLGVRFAGTNGRPFRSLTNILTAHGLLRPGQGRLAEIRRVLEGLSEEQRLAIMRDNERFVFFRIDDGGARGSLGVELTAGRSIATDPRLVPLGSVGYLVTPTYRRFVVSQDTGAAIVGAHADLFMGAGADAGVLAGQTNERGTLYVLEPAS